MDTSIMVIAVDLRTHNAPKLQEVLTKHGCIIKMRLGLHETSRDQCSERGLILLQLSGEDSDIEAFKEDLISLQGITFNTMSI